jgi:hypothetical protein
VLKFCNKEKKRKGHIISLKRATAWALVGSE